MSLRPTSAWKSLPIIIIASGLPLAGANVSKCASDLSGGAGRSVKGRRMSPRCTHVAGMLDFGDRRVGEDPRHADAALVGPHGSHFLEDHVLPLGPLDAVGIFDLADDGEFIADVYTLARALVDVDVVALVER